MKVNALPASLVDGGRALPYAVALPFALGLPLRSRGMGPALIILGLIASLIPAL